MKRFFMVVFISLTFLLNAPVIACEFHEAMSGSLQISDAWTREIPPAAQTGGAYLTIANTGLESDVLLGGSADFADLIEIHNMTMENGVMSMFPLQDGLIIPAGAAVELKPGGLHVMMMGVNASFKKGDMVSIDLTFEKAGTVTVDFLVMAIGAKNMDHHHH
jgi:copper(I)-binding protein